MSTNPIESEKEVSIKKAIEHMRDRRPLRAEEVCRDYLQDNPGCTDHLRLLSNALMRQNRFTEAEEQLRFALSLKGDFPQLHEDLGSVLAQQGKFDEAIVSLERAIQLEPNLPLAHKKLGHALAQAGRGEDADEAFQEHIQSDPDRAEIVAGVELMRTDKLDEAAEIFRKVL